MLGINGLLLLFLGALLAPQTLGQSENTELIKVLFKRSEYVNQVFFQLLFANLDASLLGNPIPDPMKFDNFTYNHQSIFQAGESNTYDPLLFGYVNSVLSVDANVETYQANIHLTIPQVHLTGMYDLWLDQSSPWGIGDRYRGNGAYAHTFTNVELWLNLTVGEGGRPIATDIGTSLRFNSCRLWAENFTHNGIFWDETKWEVQSGIFKQEFDSPEKAGAREILLTEGARSYFNILWGILKVDRDQALQILIELGTILNP